MEKSVLINRISFFERDSAAQFEVEIQEGNFSYASEILVPMQALNRVLNGIHAAIEGVSEQFRSRWVQGEGTFFELDLRSHTQRPMLDMQQDFFSSDLKQIRA